MSAIVFTLIVTGGVAVADSCPTPKSAVDPMLTGAVTFDKKSQTYRYRYMLKNGPNSVLSIDYFGLYLGQKPVSTISAANWRSDFVELGSAPTFLLWNTFGIDSREANKVTNDTSLPVHIYSLKPGQSVSGFEITSPHPPGLVQFFAEGETQFPYATSTAANDEPETDCPGWNLELPKIQRQVTGSVTGPSDPNLTTVRIRAREEGGEGRCGDINPAKPTGRISVLILSSGEFDATQIDIPNAMFGPGYAKPVASKVVTSGKFENIAGDEKSVWEEFLEGIHHPRVDSGHNRPKNLLLTFLVADLDVQCNLDRSLFLIGKTTAGKRFIGSVPTKLSGCKPKELGEHHGKQPRFEWWKRLDGAK
ncbi:MAG: hypothetical protein H7301_05780 [Cryobacterium sp.]|nr:hypothetical protein [Oligoflexia bacterium]